MPHLPENYQEMLNDYVSFYQRLDDAGRLQFDARFEKFLASVKITGANAEVEDLDRVLIGAAAIIPVFYIPDWEYVNLKEVLLYPGNFNQEFEQHGHERPISGMVGTVIKASGSFPIETPQRLKSNAGRRIFPPCNVQLMSTCRTNLAARKRAGESQAISTSSATISLAAPAISTSNGVETD